MDISSAIAYTDQYFSNYLTEKKIPGIAYGLIKDGQLVHVKGFGETVIGSGSVPNCESAFRIASMTKSFTATAILLLRDRGALRLDDEITKYLPWTDSMGIPDNGHIITIRDLLTMNAGFPTDDPWGDRQESLEIETFDDLVSQGLSFARAPRMGFEYSNLGYALLGRVITKASGMDYLKFVESEIHQPLNMLGTTYHQSQVSNETFVQGYVEYEAGMVAEPLTIPGAFSAMGGILSNVSDLAKWVIGFQESWSSDSKHPLQRWSRREMQEPQRHVRTTTSLDSESGNIKSITTSYGFGLYVDEDSLLGRFVSHSGGYPGFGSHMRWHPESGWGIIGLGNRTYAPMSPACTEVMNILVKDHHEKVAKTESALWPATIAAMNVVEALLLKWDDDRASANFAINMDMDQPRSERISAIRSSTGHIVEIRRVPGSFTSTTPAQAKWSIEGESGHITVELLMSPELPPKIQTIKVAKSPR